MRMKTSKYGGLGSLGAARRLYRRRSTPLGGTSWVVGLLGATETSWLSQHLT
jgi:hypothetical protein